jgi:chlorobactene glucosyltransferase
MTLDLIAFYSIGGVLLITTTIIVYNYCTAPRILNQSYTLVQKPLVSILVPARNEEKNITETLLALLQQSYTNYEVIVLDDQSEDNTFRRAEEIARTTEKVTLLRGKPLPAGWLGKNWACFQLAQYARGEVYLFIDADVHLSTHALEAALHTMHKHKVVMLSCFPAQKIGSLGALLVVPLMNWLLLSFLPLRLVTASSYPSLAAANGQFMLCSKKPYDEIGGHEALADQVVEDMEMARRFKRLNYPIMAALSYGALTCRMYGGFIDAFKGFSKNFFPGFNLSPPIFLCILTALIMVFFTPFIFVIFRVYYLWLILIIFTGRVIVSRISLQNPLANVMLHPLQMLCMVLIGANSLYWTVTGKTVWKGRTI